MAETMTAFKQLQQLLADEWEFRVQAQPLLATRWGEHRFDDKLPSVAADTIEQGETQLRSFRDRLKAIDRAALDADEQLNYDIFARYLADELARHEFRVYLMPLSKVSSGSFQAAFADLADEAPLNSVDAYACYIARLEAFAAYTSDYIELMRVGMREGYVPARVVLEGIEHSIQSHIVAEPDESLFFKPFRSFPAEIDETDQRRLAEAGRVAIRRSVVPGYQELLRFVTDMYIPAARTEIAASALPHGQAYYEWCIRCHTTLDTTPQQIHDIGLDEVRRIEAEMESVMRKTGFAGTLRAFTDFLRTDERFYADTPEALLKEVALILKRMDGELPRLFRVLPRMPYGIRPIPDHIAPHRGMATIASSDSHYIIEQSVLSALRISPDIGSVGRGQRASRC